MLPFFFCSDNDMGNCLANCVSVCIHAFKHYTLLLYHCVNSSLKLETLVFILNKDFHFVSTKVPGPPWLITRGKKKNNTSAN